MIESQKIKRFRGNLAQFKSNQDRSKINTTSDDFLLAFRLTAISNCLTKEISKEEREELEVEYKKLMQKRKDKMY